MTERDGFMAAVDNLWTMKLNTFDIAIMLGVSEAKVANMLAFLRDTRPVENVHS